MNLIQSICCLFSRSCADEFSGRRALDQMNYLSQKLILAEQKRV